MIRCSRCNSNVLGVVDDELLCGCCGALTFLQPPCRECRPLVVYHAMRECPRMQGAYTPGPQAGRRAGRLLKDRRKGMWATGYECCQDCGRTDRRHGGNGLCCACFDRAKRRERPKDPKFVALGRLGGSKGGKAVADSRTPEERREMAAHAANVRWGKAG